jgi:hypothetical protein
MWLEYIILLVNTFLNYLTGFPSRRPWLDPRPGYVGFVVDKVTLWWIFSEYLGSAFQFQFSNCETFIHHAVMEDIYFR